MPNLVALAKESAWPVPAIMMRGIVLAGEAIPQHVPIAGSSTLQTIVVALASLNPVHRHHIHVRKPLPRVIDPVRLLPIRRPSQGPKELNPRRKHLNLRKFSGEQMLLHLSTNPPLESTTLKTPRLSSLWTSFRVCLYKLRRSQMSLNRCAPRIPKLSMEHAELSKLQIAAWSVRN